MKKKDKPRILIYHTGSIGDTLAIVPLLPAIRAQFSDATLELLNSSGGGANCAEQLLLPAGFVDNVISYSLPRNIFSKVFAILKLWWVLRRKKYCEVIYLIRSGDNFSSRAGRDKCFFYLSGIRTVRGIREIDPLPGKEENGFLPEALHHTVLFAHRLAADGIVMPADEQLTIDLKLTACEHETASACFSQIKIPAGKIPVAIGVGGKKQVGRWPLAKYRIVLDELIENDNIFPVFLGGKDNINDIDELLQELTCGFNAATLSALSLREHIALLALCAFYLGNDTGTLHMAVAAGLKCVGIYCSHNYSGIWSPLGDGHIVLRRPVECELCFLHTCDSDPARCIDKITVDDVTIAARKMLGI